MISLNFVIFLISLLIISTSVFGYGFLFANFNRLQKNINLGYIGIFGIFILISYSYLSNLFVPHSQLHNTIIILLGIILFFFFLKKMLIKLKLRKDFFILFALFPLILISLLIFKNHDDFGYYHFQYTYYLTYESFNFGVGKFNHGFRTPSSIFYLNSLFFLPVVKYYLFNLSSALILVFANIILLDKIGVSFKNKKFMVTKNQTLLFTKFLSLFSLIFINIFFYRLSEHGTDRSAQILIVLLIIEIIDFFINNKFEKLKLVKLYILFGIIVSLKAFYFLYIVFLIPIFLYTLKKNLNFTDALKTLFLNKYFLYVFFLLSLVVFSYFSNTGCFLYPLKMSCFEQLQWSIPLIQVDQMNNWYELWSKAGANPNKRVENPDQYIQGFNWVYKWFDEYFFTKVSDFLLGILFVILIFFSFFYRHKFKIKIKINLYVILTIILLFIILCEWFYNHPALRYGGYSIIALLLFIPSSIILSSCNVTKKQFNYFAAVLIVISLATFLGRNINRIDQEVKKYDYKPFNQTFYLIDDKYFNLQNKMNEIKNNFEECQKIKKNCNSKKKISKIYSKYIY